MTQTKKKVKKDIQNLLKENELNIIVQRNMKMVNYLDVTLNLENSTYRLYQKNNNNNNNNNQIKCINIESNQQPSIIKQLPLSIESRLYLPQEKSSTTLSPHTKIP